MPCGAAAEAITALDSAKQVFDSTSTNSEGHYSLEDLPADSVLTFGGSGAGEGEMSSPSGVAIDFADFICVADRGNYRIQKFNTSGQFQSPVGVATDSAGDVYVLDSARGCVQRFGER